MREGCGWVGGERGVGGGGGNERVGRDVCEYYLYLKA